MNQLIFQSPEDGLTLFRTVGNTTEMFADVLKIRRHNGDNPCEFGFDLYSYHYVLYHDGQPVGTATATRLRDGELDCQSYYPPSVLKNYRDKIISACKFRVLKHPHSGFRANRLIMREAWRDQLSAGMRIDLINAREALIPLYRRMGYVVVPNSEFLHPELHTPSVVMLITATPDRRSFCQDLVQDLEDPLSLEEVLNALKSDELSES